MQSEQVQLYAILYCCIAHGLVPLIRIVVVHLAVTGNAQDRARNLLLGRRLLCVAVHRFLLCAAALVAALIAPAAHALHMLQ
jgi:hypothetical protein